MFETPRGAVNGERTTSFAIINEMPPVGSKSREPGMVMRLLCKGIMPTMQVKRADSMVGCGM